MDASGDELAAVIAEPLPANMGVVPPADGFLELLRDALRRMRSAPDPGRGDQRLSRRQRVVRRSSTGLSADITVLGKVLGGGLPLAAVAGPRSLMERLAPAGETYQAGTLSGNPLATAAGLATLALLTPGAYAQPRAIDRPPGRRPARGCRATPAPRSTSPRPAASLTVFFSERPVDVVRGRARLRTPQPLRVFTAAMLEQGIYLPPSPFEAWFPSLAHTRRPDRAHDRGRDGGIRGRGRMSARAAG